MRVAAAAAILLVSCSSPPSGLAALSSIRLFGKASYADGTPASQTTIQASLVLTGDGLFPAGVNGCSPGDEHAQAMQTVSVRTSMNGSFTLNAPMNAFHRATDETCAMAQAAAAHVTRVDVRVQADADFASCLPYCRRYPADTCYSDCASRGQKFVWVSTFTPAQVDGAIGIVQFEDLGPPLEGTPPDETPLPDLMVDGAAAHGSLRLDTQTFAADACAVQDACVFAPGERKLLRFDGDIQNLGAGDLRIGSPVNNPLFSYSACHDHYHLKNIMTFELLDPDGEAAVGDMGEVIARKQGFCIQGIQQIAGNSPDPYTCDDQGLAPGWEDIYAATLNCQWLDVTGVPPGQYALRITVNAGRTFPESDFDNNSATIPVSIP